MTTVYDILTDARGSALIGRPVTIRLRTGGRIGAFHADNTSHIVQATVVKTDATGRWEADLAPLDAIEPLDSYYTVDAVDADTIAFVVPPAPTDGTALWVRDLLVQAPESNGSVIAGVTSEIVNEVAADAKAYTDALAASLPNTYAPIGLVPGVADVSY